ncbi:MAG: arylamine N-acetyltransferase [Anaerolineae bacterium]|nr:arylamine N-acetyltransferase [Anaerolineae bacterium]
MQLDHILEYLGIKAQTPSVALLYALMDGYTKRVPWESASRIARRADVTATEDCPRWPDEFWDSALEYGTGGTCFESNYAFSALLTALGFETYLTINNMGSTLGCHTACVVTLADQRWLMDAGYPVHVPLPLDPTTATEAVSPYLSYAAVPDGARRFQIERTPHPKPNCFTLIDLPVPDSDYRAATIADYGVNGLFLDTIIINKLVNGQLCRFTSAEQPFHIQRFVNGYRYDDFIDDPSPENVATKVAQFFTIDQTILQRAFANLRH